MTPSLHLAVVTTCLTACLAGCGTLAQFERIPPETTEIGACATAVPDIAWNAVRGNPEVWTQDGPTLQALHLFKDLEDGNPLFPQRGRREESLLFRKDMTAHEIVELLADSLSAMGAAKVQVTDLRPYRLGSSEAFRFRLTYVSQGGIDGQGIGVGAVIRQRLLLVLYRGVGPFFAAYEPHAEAFITSLQLRPQCEQHETPEPIAGEPPER